VSRTTVAQLEERVAKLERERLDTLVILSAALRLIALHSDPKNTFTEPEMALIDQIRDAHAADDSQRVMAHLYELARQ
jgi:hypothetical protein